MSLAKEAGPKDACLRRDKKKFWMWDFGFWVYAQMIEKLRLSGYFIQLLRYTAGGRGGRLDSRSDGDYRDAQR